MLVTPCCISVICHHKRTSSDSRFLSVWSGSDVLPSFVARSPSELPLGPKLTSLSLVLEEPSQVSRPLALQASISEQGSFLRLAEARRRRSSGRRLAMLPSRHHTRCTCGFSSICCDKKCISTSSAIVAWIAIFCMLAIATAATPVVRCIVPRVSSWLLWCCVFQSHSASHRHIACFNRVVCHERAHQTCVNQNRVGGQ